MLIALRSLLRTPAFFVTALLSIGLSVGVAETAFGVIDAVRFRALPFKDGDRLVVLTESQYSRDGAPIASPCRAPCDMQYVTYDVIRRVPFRSVDLIAAF